MPVDLGTGRNISSAFQTKFRTFEMDPNKPAVADASGRSGRNAAGGAKLAASLSSDALVEKPDAQPGGIHGAAPSPAWYGRDAA